MVYLGKNREHWHGKETMNYALSVERKKRKPDVHHIIPFRISRSHSLDNLICLCKPCHSKEEAKITDHGIIL